MRAAPRKTCPQCGTGLHFADVMHGRDPQLSGRPRVYCSDRCRKAAVNNRRRKTRNT